MGGTKIKKLSVSDAAYLAGLIDGEGCISVTRTNTSSSAKGCKRGFSYRASITMTMTDAGVLRWAHKTTGVGTVVAKKSTGEGHRSAWAWQVWSNQAQSLAEALLPYLRVKTRQAKRLIEFQEMMRFPGTKGLHDSEWNKREAIYFDFRKMNQRGIHA